MRTPTSRRSVSSVLIHFLIACLALSSAWKPLYAETEAFKSGRTDARLEGDSRDATVDARPETPDVGEGRGVEGAGDGIEGEGDEVPEAGEGVSRGADESNPINITSGLLDEWREDGIDRINEYLWSNFIEGADEARQPINGKTGTRAMLVKLYDAALAGSATAGKQPSEGVGLGGADLFGGKTQAERIHLASLYYIIGAGQGTLAQAKPEVKAVFEPQTQSWQDFRRDVFAKLTGCLARYTNDTGEADSGDGCYFRDPKFVPDWRQPGWTMAFFVEAAVTAHKIFQASRVPRDVPVRTIREHDDPPVVPGGPTGGRRGTGGVDLSKPFGVGDMFGEWGEPNVIALPLTPGDENNTRHIAVVIRTIREFTGDPPQAVFKQQVGIYDISHESNLYGKRFDIKSEGKIEFKLKDGGSDYVLEFVPSGSDTLLKLSRPNGAQPINSADKSANIPSVNQLFRMRAEKARKVGNITKVGGREYLVSGEASDTGKLLFWPLDMFYDQDGNPKELPANMNARSLVPELVANTNHMSGGSNVPMGSQITLGQVDGQWYDLKWNAELGYWEPVEGKPPATAPPPSDGAGDPETEQRGPTERETTPDGEDPGGGSRPVEVDRETGELVFQNYSDKTALVAPINEKLAAHKMRVYERKPEVRGPKQERFIALHKDSGASERLFPLGYAQFSWQNPPLWVVADRLLAVADGAGILYLDMSKGIRTEPALVPLGDGQMGYNLQEGTWFFGVGTFNMQGKAFAGADKDAFGDSLIQAGGEVAGKKTEIMGHLEDKIKDNGAPSWLVSRPTYAEAQFKNGSVVWQLYPKLEEQSGAVAVPETPGPGYALDKEGLGAPTSDDKVPEYIVIEEKEVHLAHVTSDRRAGVYYRKEESGAGDNKKTKEYWYLSFVVKDSEGDHRFPGEKNKHLLIFERPKGKRIEPPWEAGKAFDPAKLKVRGFAITEKLPSTSELKWGPKQKGSDPLTERGIYAAYHGTAGKQHNCLGVVAYWGMSGEQAQELCTSK